MARPWKRGATPGAGGGSGGAARAGGGAHGRHAAIPEGVEKPRKKRTLARIGVEDIQEATARLMRYKQGKAVLDSRIAGNEEWWKLRHWEEMAGRPASARKYARPARGCSIRC